jgi:hypothetical protein
LNAKILLGAILVAFLSTQLIGFPAQVSADTVLKSDFEGESFAKTVDYFDYARAYALLHGLPKPPDYWHANVYMTYVNKMGLQMLYAGLSNISLADKAYLTIPMQTILLHYKTEDLNQDALVASSFLMIMGFNDTATSIYRDSPDRNDTLWASFSFGVNLRQIFPNADLPSLNTKCEIFPLTPSDDKLTWKWGMRYINLTALWITTFITDENETDTSKPWGLATYDELTFNYTLSIDPDNNMATIHQDHVIGKMRDLWTFWGWLWNHYNGTGCYWLGNKVSDETIYQFLSRNNVKMSIVNFQTSLMIDNETYCTSKNGQNVTDNDVLVSSSSISTYAENGERIFDADFGAKETYKLFNYTEYPTETESTTYNASTRTARIEGYAKNKNLFSFHRTFAKYLPLALVHMYPQLYQRAKLTITNMTRADYLYTISYPNYSGYRIVHDPVYTVYFALTAETAVGPNLGGLLVLALVGGTIAAISIIIIRRKGKKKAPESENQPPLPPAPPAAI